MSNLPLDSIDANAEQQLKLQLYRDLDSRNARTMRIRHTIESIEDLVFNKILEDLRAGKMNGYDGATCLAKLTSSIVSMERLRLDCYKTLIESGIPKVMVEAIEASEEKELKNKDISRFAERLLIELVRQRQS